MPLCFFNYDLIAVYMQRLKPGFVNDTLTYTLFLLLYKKEYVDSLRTRLIL